MFDKYLFYISTFFVILFNIINLNLFAHNNINNKVFLVNDTLSITDIDFCEDKMYICINFKEILVSSDYGNSWSKLIFPFSDDNNYFISQIVIYENIIIAYHMDGTLFLSIDSGNNWINDLYFKDSNVYNNINTEDNIYIRNVHIFNRNIYICTNKGLFRKFYKNNSWERISFYTEINFDNVYFFDNIYYISNDEGLFYNYKIDNNWNKFSTLPINKRKSVYSLIKINNDIYISTDSGVFCTNNSGINWIDFTKNLKIPEGEFDDVLMLFFFKNKVYVKSVNGIYYYNEAIEIWEKIYFIQLPENYRRYWSQSSSVDYLFLGSQSGDFYISYDGLNFFPIKICFKK